MFVSQSNNTFASARPPVLLTVLLSFAIASLGQAAASPKTIPPNAGSPAASRAASRPSEPALDNSTITPGLTFRNSPDTETPYTFTTGEPTTVAQPTATVAQAAPPRKPSGGFDPLSPVGLAAGAAVLAALAGIAWYIIKRQA